MATYAYVENNVIIGLYDNLPQNWKNISNFYLFADDTETLGSMGWKTIQKISPTYDSATQYLGETYHRIVDDEVVETQYVIDKPEEIVTFDVELSPEQLHEIDLINHTEAMFELRRKRDELLKATDFTQLSDVIELNGPTLSQAYKDYRQALRNLPSIYEFDDSFINESLILYPALADFIPQSDGGV